MDELTTTTETAYTALTEGAAVRTRLDAGLLRLHDADRVDFLQRMSTNDINTLQPGQAAVTILTSPVARIDAVFTVLCRPDELWLLPAPGGAEDLAQRLRSQIFFMDKVKVTDLSQEYTRLRVIGPKAGAVLAKTGFAVQDEPDGTFEEENGVVALKQMAYDLPGYELIVPAADVQALVERLGAVGAHLLPEEEAEDGGAYEIRRVELGRPRVGHELVDDFNPLEAGMAWVCAENKGCYTGQEIIARQISYDKVTKTLVGLYSQEPLDVGTDIEAADESRAAGMVTSAVYSPNLGRPIALAVIRRPHNQPGTTLTADGQTVTVVGLPFV